MQRSREFDFQQDELFYFGSSVAGSGKRENVRRVGYRTCIATKVRKREPGRDGKIRIVTGWQH